MSTPTRYRDLTAADLTWETGDEYYSKSADTWLLATPGCRNHGWAPARRPIPTPALTWIRSGDRKPTAADLPLLFKRNDNVFVAHDLCNTTLTTHADLYPFLWAPFHEPADPSPSQRDLDDDGFRAYWSTNNHTDPKGIVKPAWDAGVEYGRTHPAKA